MNEKLLQYIWQFQCFNIQSLAAQNGDPISISAPGTYNSNQGPDFSGARIKIGDTLWAGNVELHVLSSDWKAHQHDKDSNYRNIILHVVWEDDVDLQLPFATLELKDRVPKILLEKYHALMQEPATIPCGKAIGQVNEFIFTGWKERLLVERLLEKSRFVLQCFKESNNHWEATCWRILARNFGAKVNSEAFEKIAESIPVTILAKYKNQVQQIEALLLGQANLLTGTFNDSYCIMLQREYAFLKKKYQLLPAGIALQQLRMRPSNFPAVRLAQLASLVNQSNHLFTKMLEASAAAEVMKLLNVTAGDYWHYHYVLAEPSGFKEKNIGTQMSAGIVINSVVPLLFAYGNYMGEEIYKKKALRWLDELAGEKNAVTQTFAALGIKIKTAFDSQALIQLKNLYCNNKRCLECAVGNHLLKKMPA